MYPRSLLCGVLLLVACGDKDTETEDTDTDTIGLSPDRDADGYGEDVDCDDTNPNINPGAEELCNGSDDNCDGQVDEGVIGTFYPDADEDGYGNMDSPIEMCEIQPGLIERGEDCDDLNPDISPDGVEVCDGEDNNCDSQIDEGTIVTLYRDEDEDGYGQDGTGTEGCPNGIDAELAGDCDDFDDSQYPGAREICGDGIINDCDATEEDAIAACTGELEGGLVIGLAHAFTGPESGSYAGYSVDSAGDINADGKDEIMVGAPSAAVNGAVYLVSSGTEEGSLGTAAAVTITGTTSKGGFGTAVDGVGDLDGDGYDDIVVTAYTVDEGYLFYGPLSGDITADEADAFFIDNTYTGAYGGYSVQAAGDVNQDGYQDLIFGAPLVSIFDQFSGAAVISYGPFEGDDVLGTSTLVGESYYAQVGWSVAGVGDVNGDGYEDLLAGGRYSGIGTDDGMEYPGSAYLYYGPVPPETTLTASEADVQLTASTQFDLGGEIVTHAGDLNNDGYQDVLVSEDDQDLSGRIALFYGSGSLGSGYSLDDSDASFSGEAAEHLAISVAQMGDANSDGYGDLAIGAYGASGGYGAAYLVFGPFSGAVDLSDSGLKIMSDSDGFLGFSVSSAGDFDGDSLTDILVGAPEADGKGTAYVVPRVGTGAY